MILIKKQIADTWSIKFYEIMFNKFKGFIFISTSNI